MKYIILIITAFFIINPAQAEDVKTKYYFDWKMSFEQSLKPKMSRYDAEKVIAKVRNIKSKYRRYDHYYDDVIVYRLDKHFALIVWYSEGVPKDVVIDGHRVKKAIEPKYLRHVVTDIH